MNLYGEHDGLVRVAEAATTEGFVVAFKRSFGGSFPWKGGKLALFELPRATVFTTVEDAQRWVDAYECVWCGYLPGEEPTIKPLAEVLRPLALFDDERAEVEALQRDQVAA